MAEQDDDSGSRGGSIRLNSTSGGKSYYPTIVEADNDSFRVLTEKLTKDWLICLLKDSVAHLREAKSTSSILNEINENLGRI